MKQLLQVGLSVWIGVFLVLPNCLCQVLCGLGISIHGNAPQHSSATLSAGSLLPVACHCHDTSLKTAECKCGEGVVSDDDIVAFALLGEGADRGLLTFSTRRTCRAPPPPDLASLARSHEWNCSFLL